MSKRNKIKNEAVNNEVKTEETNIVEGEQTEVKEKKGIFYGIGHAAGVVANGVSKVVTSTPGKIVTGVVVIGAAIVGGYEAGKHGLSSGKDTDEALTDGSEPTGVSESDSTAETEEN